MFKASNPMPSHVSANNCSSSNLLGKESRMLRCKTVPILRSYDYKNVTLKEVKKSTRF
jgi:hypothetical protein